MTELSKFDQIMIANEYIAAHEIGDGRWVALFRFLFTTAIIVGNMRDYDISYDDRWCYHNLEDAMSALKDWREKGYVGEPDGWRRHPRTGRRRQDGSAELEYIDP